MSRLLFRGFGVADTSLPLHAALAGARATLVIDEAHIIQTYEANVRRCVELGADLHVMSMSATPTGATDSVLRLGDDYGHGREQPGYRHAQAEKQPAA